MWMSLCVELRSITLGKIGLTNGTIGFTKSEIDLTSTQSEIHLTNISESVVFIYFSSSE